MSTPEQNIEATIRYPFKVDPHNPGIIRGGWFDEMGGLLVGAEAQYVADALNGYATFLKPESEPEPELTIEQAAAKADAFDFSRATNLYLVAARDLGTCLGGHSLTDLLADRTDWDLDKCKRLGDRVIDDQALIDLLKFEGIPEAYENG